MPAAPNAQRDAKIVAAARLGQTHEAIAREHGITRTRVSQIVHAATPRTPEEAQRQLIAARLRSRWDELEKIVHTPPIKTTSIGRTQWDPRSCSCGVRGDTKREHAADCKVQPVLDMTAVTGAIKAQLQVEQQYRQMFGVDLGTRPGPVLDERQIVMMAEIRAVQQYRAQQAPVSPLPALLTGYGAMTADEQMRAQLERHRTAKTAHDAAIAAAADDDVVDAELVDE